MLAGYGLPTQGGYDPVPSIIGSDLPRQSRSLTSEPPSLPPGPEVDYLELPDARTDRSLSDRPPPVRRQQSGLSSKSSQRMTHGEDQTSVPLQTLEEGNNGKDFYGAELKESIGGGFLGKMLKSEHREQECWPQSGLQWCTATIFVIATLAACGLTIAAACILTLNLGSLSEINDMWSVPPIRDLILVNTTSPTDSHDPSLPSCPPGTTSFGPLGALPDGTVTLGWRGMQLCAILATTPNAAIERTYPNRGSPCPPNTKRCGDIESGCFLNTEPCPITSVAFVPDVPDPLYPSNASFTHQGIYYKMVTERSSSRPLLSFAVNAQYNNTNTNATGLCYGMSSNEGDGEHRRFTFKCKKVDKRYDKFDNYDYTTFASEYRNVPDPSDAEMGAHALILARRELLWSKDCKRTRREYAAFIDSLEDYRDSFGWLYAGAALSFIGLAFIIIKKWSYPRIVSAWAFFGVAIVNFYFYINYSQGRNDILSAERCVDPTTAHVIASAADTVETASAMLMFSSILSVAVGLYFGIDLVQSSCKCDAGDDEDDNNAASSRTRYNHSLNI